MKSYSNLYPQIYDFENLQAAYQRARRGKAQTAEMYEYNFNLEENLWDLHEALVIGSYQPGAYRHFHIYEPKRRKVSAAPFRDRVVHHALCRVIEPLFERCFIHDSYANRVGKGTHKALERAQGWARHYPFALKMDLLKFFPSVDHEILRQVLAQKVACAETLALCEGIIASGQDALTEEYICQWFPGDDLFSPLARLRGLPIGNLTSQFWGNVLLNQLDHFVKEKLQRRAYIRYVDDFLVFGQSKAELWEIRQAIAAYLCSLRLTLHPRKTQVMPTSRGVPFLGFRLFPTHKRLLSDSLRRARRPLRKQRQAMAQGDLSPEAFRRSLASWVGHVGHGDTWQLRELMLGGVTWKIGNSL